METKSVTNNAAESNCDEEEVQLTSTINYNNMKTSDIEELRLFIYPDHNRR